MVRDLKVLRRITKKKFKFLRQAMKSRERDLTCDNEKIGTGTKNPLSFFKSWLSSSSKPLSPDNSARVSTRRGEPQPKELVDGRLKLNLRLPVLVLLNGLMDWNADGVSENLETRLELERAASMEEERACDDAMFKNYGKVRGNVSWSSTSQRV